MTERSSTFSNSLIWFGAAISIAEIMTGILIAPLGFYKGFLAIVIGHIIGCTLMYFAGLIGGNKRLSAMETVSISFGNKGKLLFVILNIIQLIGWTSIMIYDGAVAANSIFGEGIPIWSIVIGLLTILWVGVGITNLGKLNIISMSLLFVLTVVLSIIIFNKEIFSLTLTETLSFGEAVELSAAMPLSWLPLISDYTKDAEHPKKATLFSVITYGVVSSWMYMIGMGATIVFGVYDIAEIMGKAGLGIAGLLIIVLSTTTTTFLDAYSTGVSSESLSKKISAKWVGIITVVAGVLSAIFFPLYDITDFLYFIGSVFAPMIAIQIADYFILKIDCSDKNIDISNIIIWLFGFLLYRFLMKFDLILGCTFPSMVIIIFVCFIYKKIKNMVR